MGMMLAALMLLQQAAPAAAAPPSPPAPCADARHGEFDFWVGEWDVYPASGAAPVARSVIEKLYAGCAIRENWMPLNGAAGGSLNGVDRATGRWVQRWIGSGGEVVDFSGGLTGEGVMVLTGYWPDYDGAGNTALVRMEYSRVEAGAVRQHGLISWDHGRSWRTGFDFIYRPKAG